MITKTFLQWMINRLYYKYDEKDTEVFDRLNRELISLQEASIDPQIINRIVRKHWFDFDMDKDDRGLGYTPKERSEIIDQTTAIVSQYIKEAQDA